MEFIILNLPTLQTFPAFLFNLSRLCRAGTFSVSHLPQVATKWTTGASCLFYAIIRCSDQMPETFVDKVSSPWQMIKASLLLLAKLMIEELTVMISDTFTTCPILLQYFTSLYWVSQKIVPNFEA